MLNVDLNESTRVAMIEPHGPLEVSDFVKASEIIDPFIETHGDLKGVILSIAAFPGWDSLAAMLEHLKFVKDHHRQVECVAVVTDAGIGALAESVAAHFIAAEIKHFGAGQMSAARQWIIEK
jgi:hypothetical protein